MPGSTLVTAMAQSSVDFGIRVSGLGSRWFHSPLPPVQGKYFDGFNADDAVHMGGESMINETIGLGAFAAPAAFALAPYVGGIDAMVQRYESMYQITIAEHDDYVVPFSGRGVPVGIDVRLVIERGIVPAIHTGIAHHQGGQIGAGLLEAPIAVFHEAGAALGALDRSTSASEPKRDS